MSDNTCDIETSVSKYKIQLGRYDSIFDSALSDYKSALAEKTSVDRPCNESSDADKAAAQKKVDDTKSAIEGILDEEETYLNNATTCLVGLKTQLSGNLDKATSQLVGAQTTSELDHTIDETNASKERLENTFAVYNYYIYAIVLLIIGMLILAWLIYANREKIDVETITQSIPSLTS